MEKYIAELLGLPDWSPRRIKRAAGWFLIATAVVAPVTFQGGLRLFVEHQVEWVERRMQPVLEDVSDPPAPVRPARLRPRAAEQ